MKAESNCFFLGASLFCFWTVRLCAAEAQRRAVGTLESAHPPVRPGSPRFSAQHGRTGKWLQYSWRSGFFLSFFLHTLWVFIEGPAELKRHAFFVFWSPKPVRHLRTEKPLQMERQEGRVAHEWRGEAAGDSLPVTRNNFLYVFFTPIFYLFVFEKTAAPGHSQVIKCFKEMWRICSDTK